MLTRSVRTDLSASLPSSESSKPSARKPWRTPVGLCTFGALFVAASGACSAPPSGDAAEDDDGKELPSTVDVNGDGVEDTLGQAVDADGDGVPDPFDFHGDGSVVGPGVDTNGDGIADAIGHDTNGDGIYDALDTDGDGTPDRFATTPEPVGDGDGDLNFGDGDGDKPSGQFCDEFSLNFEPQTPTVYLLVDKSGSMGSTGENFWEPLKQALLPAVQALQADVRFGFGTYTSTAATQCGAPSSVVDDLGIISENNFEAISTKYSSYTDPTTGDTPTSFAIDEATQILLADPSPGDRYIVLVTDGNPDFCDNAIPKCAQDATVAALQNAYAQGVQTIVFGLEAQLQQPLDTVVMSLFANAGAGQPVAWAAAVPQQMNQVSSQLSYECGTAPWPAMAAGNNSIATYGETSGTATAFLGTDPEALVASLSTVVEGLKSCSIEFNFDVVDASAGQLYVDNPDTPIPATDWAMREGSTSIVDLLGASCEKWQSPDVSYFFAGFPCAAIKVK